MPRRVPPRGAPRQHAREPVAAPERDAAHAPRHGRVHRAAAPVAPPPLSSYSPDKSRPSPRTKWTSLVPPLVLSGHAASLTPCTWTSLELLRAPMLRAWRGACAGRAGCRRASTSSRSTSTTATSGCAPRRACRIRGCCALAGCWVARGQARAGCDFPPVAFSMPAPPELARRVQLVRGGGAACPISTG